MLIVLLLLLLGGLFLWRSWNQMRLTKIVSGGLVALNSLIFLAAVTGAVLLWLGTPVPTFAQPLVQEGDGGLTGQVAMAAAIAISSASLAAGAAVAISGSAAISAIAERPEIFGRALIFVGLAEGIAIYGLIIAFMIITS